MPDLELIGQSATTRSFAVAVQPARAILDEVADSPQGHGCHHRETRVRSGDFVASLHTR